MTVAVRGKQGKGFGVQFRNPKNPLWRRWRGWGWSLGDGTKRAKDCLRVAMYFVHFCKFEARIVNRATGRVYRTYTPEIQ